MRISRRTENKIWIITIALLLFYFVVGFTYTLKTDTPAGSDDPREADDRIREAKAAIVERLDVDHYFYPSATSTYDGTDTGKHRYITFIEPNDLTSMSEDESALFSKDVSSVTELHWIDESDNVMQLTSGGEFNIALLTSKTITTPTLTTATLTTPVINTSVSGTAIKDEDDLASDSADHLVTQQSVKAYIDEKATSYIKLHESKSSGFDGGTFTAGSWVKRTVTEDSDARNNCSVSSSVIVLDAGTYEVDIICPAWAVDEHQARLRNTTAGTTLLVGTAVDAGGVESITTFSHIKGLITVAGSQNLEIQHKCTSTNASDGLGHACSMGEAEIYTVAIFRKQ